MTKHVVVAKTILVNEVGEILVLQRAVWEEDPELGHKPDFPGGQVEGGESEKDAAVRELLEETGITISPNDLVPGYTGSILYEENDQLVGRTLYIAKLDHTPEVTLSSEHESYEWLKPERVVETKEFSTFYAEGLKHIIETKLI